MTDEQTTLAEGTPKPAETREPGKKPAKAPGAKKPARKPRAKKEAAAEQAPSQVAPPPARLTQETAKALSAADERQIAAELQGKAPEAMLYSFQQDGHQILGLSWLGVREAVRQMNTRGYGKVRIMPDSAKLEEVELEVEVGTDDDGQPKIDKVPGVRATVYAADEKFGGGNFGVAVQERRMKLKKKDKKGKPIRRPDAFADAKALSKAQRNAMEGFIPLELVEELKVLYKGKGRVEYIPGTAVETDRPPALADERAMKQHERIHELYAEFKKADPDGLKKLPPGRLNGKLNSVAHDHALMDELIGQLEQLVEAAKKEGKKEEGK